MALFDIGVNLTSHSFTTDREEVMGRAAAANVTQMVFIGSDIDDSVAAIELAGRYPSCYATCGIHPHHADAFGEPDLDRLRQLSKDPLVRAIGETGLDFNRNFSAPDAQIQAFDAQLQLASELGMAAYLHQRDAHQPFLEMIKRYRYLLPNAVAHCFTGSRDELQAYLGLDLHIGITGWICDERRGSHLQEVVKHIPLHRLMLETDAPYLLPRTMQTKPRSRRNEPAFLVYVLEIVAHCLGMDAEELAAITTENARLFFKNR